MRRRLAKGITAALEPTDTSAYPEQVRPTAAPYAGKGRRPRPRYRDQPSSLAELAMAAGQQACADLIWRHGSKGLQRGRFLALQRGVTLAPVNATARICHGAVA